MKRFTALFLCFLLTCGLFAACGGNDQPEEPDSAGSSQPEGEEQPQKTDGTPDSTQELNILWTDEPSVLDVARFLGIADRNVFNNILEPLIHISQGVPNAAGAETWEVSDDGLTYTFTIRENYWSDGQKVTSGDYVTALKRQADPQNAFAFASDYYSIVGFEAASTGEGSVDDIGVEAPDDSTLVIHLSVPEPAILTTAQFFPDRADMAEQYGDAYGSDADKVLSCGPFKLTEWTHNSKLVIEKNEQYWNADNVILEKANLLIIPDSNAQLASFENGSLDYMTVSDQDYVDKFRSRDDMSEVTYETGRTNMLVFNCEDEVFSNSKIRLAFSLALDRDTLGEVIANGNYIPAYGLVPGVSSVGSLNFRQEVKEPLLELKEQQPDPKALLVEGMQEAGMGDDPSALTVTLTWGSTTATGRTYAELYQQMLQEALGCVVELEFTDTLMAFVNDGDYQMASVSWGCNLEPKFQLSRWATKVGGQSRWVNQEYNDLVNTASSTVDERERLNLYAEAEKMLVQDAAIAPTYYNVTQRFQYNYVLGIPENTLDDTGLSTVYISGKE